MHLDGQRNRSRRPFVEPLDNLPPTNPVPPPLEPPSAPPEAPQAPPKSEPQPFVDPLDNLPPASSAPSETKTPREEPPVPPMPPSKPFADPLDNLFPSEPAAREPKPEPPPSAPVEPNVPATPSVNMAIEFLRLPDDDPERFLLKSGDSVPPKNPPPRGVDAWDRHLSSDQPPAAPRPPYWDRLSPEDRKRVERELANAASPSYEEPPRPAPDSELSLAIEKRLPQKTSAHEPFQYEILIENRGREMLESVDVDEAVPPTHRLTDVSPAGYFEDHTLRWRLKSVGPGEKRRLSVEVVPTETGTIVTTTSVRPEASVASVTHIEKAPAPPAQPEPAGPPIRLRRSGYRTVSLDESIVFTNHVENLTASPQQDVKIVESVPAGFRVVQVEDAGVYDREAGTVTWELASLPPAETRTLSVRLQAGSAGELTSRVKGSTRTGDAVPILARVQAAPLPASPGAAPENCCRPKCCCP